VLLLEVSPACGPAIRRCAADLLRP